ncbi:MAG: triose-phosphate isomerase [Nitrospira sp.]|nr:triose-phosphate isomerase [Nitrospira sp.]MCP9442204.1 triose-phosphate isomerase [Nitrospira sp.]
MRPLLIVGNWKLNKTASEAAAFLRAVSLRLPLSPAVEFVVAPPFTALESARTALGSSSPIQLGAQNMFWEDHGPYTGEVSAPMLKDLGCRYVILGHSERRTVFGERDEWIHRKIRAALAHDLKPIVCIGESSAQREQERTEEVLRQQLNSSLGDLPLQAMTNVTIAYEPIWAIGTGNAATADQAANAHQAIRSFLKDRWSADVAQSTRILYGGSVTPDNIGAFLQSEQIDGALIGGACLHVESFVTIGTIARAITDRG